MAPTSVDVASISWRLWGIVSIVGAMGHSQSIDHVRRRTR
jgi:hypothetical protein